MPIDLKQLAEQAMHTRGLLPAFAPEALQEAEAARAAGPQHVARALTQPGVHDLSALTWFSIDNDDTLDLDQLSVAEALPGGRTRLMVAVADVDVLVPMGGAVVLYAAATTT